MRLGPKNRTADVNQAKDSPAQGWIDANKYYVIKYTLTFFIYWFGHGSTSSLILLCNVNSGQIGYEEKNMYEIGKINNMKVKREASFGFYLDAETGSTSDDVLLPKGSLNDRAVKLGDYVDAFVYRDSKDRIIATLKTPLITVDEVKKLKVVGINPTGAFVSMGLERDVLVPKKEQKYPLEVGKEYLFKMYVDKTNRLAATTDVNGALILPEPDTFEKGQEVKATLYGYQTNGSLYAAVDDKYRGVMLRSEFFTEVKPGDAITAKIIKILEDGRPSLTLRSDLKTERLEVKDEIMKRLKENEGFIPFNDQSTPEEIREEFQISKNYFKMALGNLMKAGLITQDEDGTHLVLKK